MRREVCIRTSTLVKRKIQDYTARPVETFRELAEQALADKKIRLAFRSWKTDRQRSAELIFEFGKIAPGDLAPGQLELFLARVKGRASGPTANRYRSLLSSIFSFGMRRGVVAANPVRAVPRFREHEGRIRFLDADEENALRDEVGRHEPELDLALNTGLRRAEQYGLRWIGVNLDREVLTVLGKGERRRIVPINSEARGAIERLRRESGGSEFVCPRWRRWFEHAVKRSGVEDFTWHDLRHTFASRLVMAGENLRTVQELLGHRSIKTTERYAHLSNEHLRSAVGKLAKRPNPQLVLFSVRR